MSAGRSREVTRLCLSSGCSFFRPRHRSEASAPPRREYAIGHFIKLSSRVANVASQGPFPLENTATELQ